MKKNNGNNFIKIIFILPFLAIAVIFNALLQGSYISCVNPQITESLYGNK